MAVAIRFSENLFPGVNPHLNSLLQTPGTDAQPSLFPTFHSAHINHIADLLNQQLPPNYTAYGEQSLQVRGFEWSGEVTVNRPEPDVSIFQKYATPPIQPTTSARPTWEAAIADVLEPLKHPVSVVIRETSEQAVLGRIVARIELLSPSNKSGSSYLEKRVEAMQSGTPLIEIDFLHETPSPLPGLPAYPTHPEAYPYSIAVSDPRPTWEAGRIRIYGFGIDEAIATVPIPLDGEDEIAFDFNAAYNHTFITRRFGNLVDYTVEPQRIYTYSLPDQQRIRQHMKQIAQSS